MANKSLIQGTQVTESQYDQLPKRQNRGQIMIRSRNPSTFYGEQNRYQKYLVIHITAYGRNIQNEDATGVTKGQSEVRVL